MERFARCRRHVPGRGQPLRERSSLEGGACAPQTTGRRSGAQHRATIHAQPCASLASGSVRTRGGSGRVAALEVLPEFAVRKSDELFDWLFVLLDDDATSVRRAASEALARAAPTFPSGIRSSLSNELRSKERHRSACAWKGLEALSKAWPDVVADHVDGLLLESDVELRRKAAKMLATIAARKTSVVWDLVSWALNDEDVQVRRIVAKSLPKLGQKDVRMGTVFAERALVDAIQVRLSAVKTIQRLNRDHGRARDLIIAGARSNDLRVRQACVDLLPKLMSEEALRVLVDDLLKTETDQKLIEKLMEYRFDASLKAPKRKRTLRFPQPCPSLSWTRKCSWPKESESAWPPSFKTPYQNSMLSPAQEPGKPNACTRAKTDPGRTHGIPR